MKLTKKILPAFALLTLIPFNSNNAKNDIKVVKDYADASSATLEGKSKSSDISYALNDKGDTIQFGFSLCQYNVNRTLERKWYVWNDLQSGMYNVNAYVKNDKRLELHLDLPEKERRGHLIYIPFKLNFKVKANSVRTVSYKFDEEFDFTQNFTLANGARSCTQFFYFGDEDSFDTRKVHPDIFFGPNDGKVPSVDRHDICHWQTKNGNFVRYGDPFNKTFKNTSNEDKVYTLNFGMDFTRDFTQKFWNAAYRYNGIIYVDVK